jgi:hypothetical protein
MARLALKRKKLGTLKTPLFSDEGTELGSYYITRLGSKFDAHLVESALRTIPWVDEACVVMAWESIPKKWVLLAAITSKTKEGNVRLEVKEHLRKLVKAYMIPNRIRIVDKLPRTGNHVDRVELAAGRAKRKAPLVVATVRSPKNTFSLEGTILDCRGFRLMIGVKPVGEKEIRISMRSKSICNGLKAGDYVTVEGKFWGLKGSILPTKVTKVKPRAAVMLTNTNDLLEALG